MISHQLITVLVTITLVEMMVAIGIKVPFADVIAAARNWSRLTRALAANYLLVPAAALILLEFLVDSRDLAVGLLIVAAFPGASFGPPFTSFARGDLSLSVGLMVLLASSSAFMGPVLLRILLHLIGMNEVLTIDVPKVIGMLVVVQLLPLAIGMSVRQFFPNLASRLKRPLELLGMILNGVSIGGILFNHFQHGSAPHPSGLYAMLILLLASLVTGYLLGGPGNAGRKTVALTTSLRNIGVGVVVASSHEVGPAALGTVVGYAIVEMTGSVLLALWWGRERTEVARRTPSPAGAPRRGEI